LSNTSGSLVKPYLFLFFCLFFLCPFSVKGKAKASPPLPLPRDRGEKTKAALSSGLLGCAAKAKKKLEKKIVE